jgi:hypothetical protein
MMVLPSLKKVKRRYTTTELLFGLGALQKIAAPLARFYLDIGGNRHLAWPSGTPLASALGDIEEKVDKIAASLLEKTMNRAWRSTSHSIDWAIRYSSNEKDDWSMKIGVELVHYFAVWAGFLPILKEKRPEVYEAVRTALGCLAGCQGRPLITVPDIYTYYIEGDLENDEDEDERAEWVHDVLQEKEEFEAHFQTLPMEETERVLSVLAGKVAALPDGALNEAERSWLERTIEYVRTSLRTSAFATPDDTSDLDCMDTCYGFVVLWKPDGVIEEYWDEVL